VIFAPPRRAIALLTCLLCAVSVWAIAGAQAGTGGADISCRTVEAGPPGPPGNVLRIGDRSDDSVTHIYRRDNRIVVFSNLASDPATCSGPAPTVTSIDRIEYSTTSSIPFLNFGGDGPLGPGATREPGAGSEIEVFVRESFSDRGVNVAGTDAAETIVLGRLGSRNLGINLNSDRDGSHQDVDVTLRADPATSFVRVAGRKGNDELSVLGGAPFSGPLRAVQAALGGGDDDDVLRGGPTRDVLSGGTGDDRMFGGRGGDVIAIGPGHDFADAGKDDDQVRNNSGAGGTPDDEEADTVLGGSGNDTISTVSFETVSVNLVDSVFCGAGRRDVANVNRADQTRGCERVAR
jgi:hypothetical protein